MHEHAQTSQVVHVHVMHNTKTQYTGLEKQRFFQIIKNWDMWFRCLCFIYVFIFNNVLHFIQEYKKMRFLFRTPINPKVFESVDSLFIWFSLPLLMRNKRLCSLDRYFFFKLGFSFFSCWNEQWNLTLRLCLAVSVFGLDESHHACSHP